MNNKALQGWVFFLAAVALAQGGQVSASAGADVPAAVGISTAAPRSALKLRFILDKDYDTHEVYGMLHHDDPAGLASRAKSMGIAPDLAQKIKNSRDYSEVAGQLGPLVDRIYAEEGAALSGSTSAYTASWNVVIGTFSEVVPAITGHAWFYEKYVCVVSEFNPGVSSWYGNKIVRKYGEDPVKQRRITAHEIALSHIFHIVRLYYTKDEIADRQVWKFAEISAVFVLNDGSLAGLWPWFNPPAEYFSKTNYPQLAELERTLAPLYKTRKSFKDYLDASISVLKAGRGN
jgi:hypothetical protein